MHFRKPWDQSTDVWSWGIIVRGSLTSILPGSAVSRLNNTTLQLAQLLLAQVDFKSPGMYDSISAGTLENKAKIARDAVAIDFDLHSIPWYAEDEKSSRMLPPPRPDEAYMWAAKMMDKGVSGEDIQFLVKVLNPLPEARLTLVEILESGYLEI